MVFFLKSLKSEWVMTGHLYVTRKYILNKWKIEIFVGILLWKIIVCKKIVQDQNFGQKLKLWLLYYGKKIRTKN